MGLGFRGYMWESQKGGPLVTPAVHREDDGGSALRTQSRECFEKLAYSA